MLAILALIASLGLAVLLAFLTVRSSSWPPATASGGVPGKVSLAVLGDSDSHSYHDRVRLPPEDGQRGGPFHATTWQWTELLDQLRGQQVDQGAWGRWGAWWPLARAQDLLGLGGRAPIKEDFRYNFALSGAGCQGLIDGRMAARLVRLMDHDPPRWTRGVVVIRIGINDFGTAEALQALSVDARDAGVQARIATCVEQIRSTVTLIHARHPQTRVVVVGMFDNSHWAPLQSRWQSRAELARITAGLDRFNTAMRDLVAHDPGRLAYFDDQAWFSALWGGRDALTGQPAYRVVTVDGRYGVANTGGDHPSHATLKDGHAGLVWNLKWAQALVALLNQRFGLGIKELSDSEIAAFLDEKTASGWQKTP